jgi:hypothetical protein
VCICWLDIDIIIDVDIIIYYFAKAVSIILGEAQPLGPGPQGLLDQCVLEAALTLGTLSDFCRC